ncbi:MAG: hypothetical protein IAF08_03480 [Rhizobacter sp.]|nr:hypothetical protein [Chlorobiales bacterium]
MKNRAILFVLLLSTLSFGCSKESAPTSSSGGTSSGSSILSGGSTSSSAALLATSGGKTWKIQTVTKNGVVQSPTIFGTLPYTAYKLTFNSDGTGTVVGEQNPYTVGSSTYTITSQNWALTANNSRIIGIRDVSVTYSGGGYNYTSGVVFELIELTETSVKARYFQGTTVWEFAVIPE